MSKPIKNVSEEKFEIDPDAWQRFECAVDVVAKSPPQHRTAKPKGKREASAIKSTRKKRG
jgi:hypothetical protein